MRGRQFMNAFERGLRRRNVAVTQISVDRQRINIARDIFVRQHPLQLRGEKKPVAEPGVKERLFTYPVAGQKETSPLSIPDSEGEHPAQPGQTINAPLLVRVDDRFSISAGAEIVSEALKFPAQLLKVVDFAVERDQKASVRIRHWLASRFGQINDRKTAMPQRAALIRPDPPGVGAAMRLGFNHWRQLRLKRSACL